MKGNNDLKATASLFAAYAAQGLAGFESHQPGGIARQPAARHDWIRGILRGMAGSANENAETVIAWFDHMIEAARYCAAVEMLSLRDQK